MKTEQGAISFPLAAVIFFGPDAVRVRPPLSFPDYLPFPLLFFLSLPLPHRRAPRLLPLARPPRPIDLLAVPPLLLFAPPPLQQLDPLRHRAVRHVNAGLPHH